MRKIDNFLGRMRAVLRQAMLLSDDTGMKIDLFVLRPTEDCDEYGRVQLGDYVIHFFKNLDGAVMDYQPVGEMKNWQDNVSPDRITAFDKPPLEKAPTTDQSEQGNSLSVQ